MNERLPAEDLEHEDRGVEANQAGRDKRDVNRTPRVFAERDHGRLAVRNAVNG